jgi:hypothetical protein
MNAKPLVALIVALAGSLILTVAAHADNGIRIGINSQQYGPHAAAASASITAHRLSPRRSATTERYLPPASPSRPTPASTTIAGASTQPLPGYPSIAADAPLLRNPRPFGPASFWSGAAGYACIYSPGSSPFCYRVVPATRAAQPGVSPQALAASVERRLALTVGVIKTSPPAQGLTGSDAWFWLDPAPKAESLSVSLAGERVTVVAEPGVEWRFGDGAILDGGAGVAYRPGPPPPGAIWHAYQTRCLPGDQGRDPYVLASCSGDGYRVRASVTWRISYSAAGPVGGSGVLPARTTETTVAYPVSEARAFLLSGTSG